MSKLPVARGIGAAMLASIIIYGVLIEIFTRGTLEGPPPIVAGDADLVRSVLYGVALVDGVLAVVLGRILRPKPGAADPESRLLAATIVSLALGESVGLLAAVLYFLTHDVTAAYPLLALSGALILVHFPRESRWRDALREAEVATSGPLAP